MLPSSLGSEGQEKLLNSAFETNDLRLICRGIDGAIRQSGQYIEIARLAEIDRVTLYRGFRLERGLALGNMVKVLRVLGFRLIVEVRPEVSNGERAIESVAEGNPRKNQFATARRFTAAFKKGEMDALVSVFRETLLSQENVAEFASKTIRSRESLYRAFTKNPMPRFSTLLSFLNALGLRFAVTRLPRPRNSRTTLA